MHEERRVERLAAAAVRGDFAAAVRVMHDALDSDDHHGALALLASVQRLVGDRWVSGTCTVAHEHSATAVIERLSWLLAEEATPEPDAPMVLLVCAEGEWHGAPARLLSDGLRLAGWDARCIPGSVPVADISSMVQETRPFAVGVSATMASALPGALRSMRAAQATGVPVIVGGAAFGRDTVRALMLGADGWAPDAPQADALLRAWLARPPRPSVGVPVGFAAWEDLRHEHGLLLAAAKSGLRRTESQTCPEAQTAAEELPSLLDAVAVAVLTTDPRVIVGHLEWRGAFLQQRGGSLRIPLLASLALDEALAGARQWKAMELLATAWASYDGAQASAAMPAVP